MARQKIEAMRVEVNGDISGLQKAMNDAVAEFRSAERALKKINESIKADPDNGNLVADKVRYLDNAIKENEKALRRLLKVQKNIFNDPNYKAGVTEMTERYATLTKMITDTRMAGQKLREELKLTKVLATEFELDRKFAQFSRILDKSREDLNRFKETAKNIDELIKFDPDNPELYRQKLENLRSETKRYWAAVTNLSKVLEAIESDENFKNMSAERRQEYEKNRVELTKLREEYKKCIEAKRTFEADVKFNKFAMQLEKSKKMMDGFQKSLGNIDKQIKLDPDNIDNYVKKHKLLGEAVKATEKEIEDLKKKQKDLVSDPTFKGDMRELTEQYTELEQELEVLKRQYEEMLRAMGVSPEMEQFLDYLDLMGNALVSAGQATSRFSRAFQTLLGSAFNSSVNFESSVAGIKRVIKDLSGETLEDLKNVAVETGNAFEDIAEYATIAGALGLSEKEVAKFTRTMVDLNTATGGVFQGEEGAKGIAVFLKQLGLGIDQAENFGSAIAVIGDKYADIGDETVNVATRLTGLTALIKTDQYELLGLAGVMADLGLGSDSAANGVNRAFMQIEKIIADTSDKGKKKMKELADTSGLTVKQFKEQWSTNSMDVFLKFTDGLQTSFFNEVNDAIAKSSDKVKDYADVLGWTADVFVKKWGENSRGVFDQYVEKLGEMDDEAINSSKVLQDLGISSVYTAQTLLRLSGSGNEVRKAISLAKEAWNENTALMEKSGVVYETTEKKLEAFKESWRQLSASFTDILLPAIKPTIDGLSSVFSELSKASPVVKLVTVAFAGFNASLSPVLLGLGYLDKALGNLLDPRKGFPNLIKLMTSPVGMIQAFGLAAIAIVGGTAALGGFLNKVENVSTPLKKLSDGIKLARNDFNEVTTSLSNNLVNMDYELYKETDYIRDNIDAIEVLKAKLKELNPQEEGYAETKAELKKRIDELNVALGTSFYYSNKQKEILDEHDDVANLTGAYENLFLAKRKAYYLESAQPAYDKALQDQKTAWETIADAKWEYAKATKDYDEELIAFAEHYAKNASGFRETQIFNSLDEDQKAAVIIIADLFNKLDETTKEARALSDESEKIISNVNKIAESEGKTLENALDAIKNGWEIDPALNDLSKLEGQLEKINFLLDNPEGLSKGQLDDLEAYKESLLKEIELTKEAQEEVTKAVDENKHRAVTVLDEQLEDFGSKFADVYNGAEGVTKQSEVAWDTIATHAEEKNTEIFDDYKEKGIKGNEELQAHFALNPLIQEVKFKLRGDRRFTSLINSGGFSVFDSAGFGDLLGSTMSAIRNSIPSLAMASGGYSSGGIVSNVTLTINNANGVNESTVNRWADVITDRINENLGKMI